MPQDVIRPVVIVTGASRGLGAAIATAAADRGFDLLLVARDAERLDAVADTCRDRGANVVALAADVCSTEAPVRALASAMETFGRVDGLVNNAGIYRTRPSSAPDTEEWDAIIRTNLTAPYEWSSVIGRAMVAAGSGSIVNIASVFALVGVARTAAYAASKGGLIAMSRAMSVEWASRGVRVNAVAAGHMLTDLTAPELEKEAAQRYIREQIPLGRVAAPAEIAPLVCLLLGADGSFITGSVHVADGGFTAR